MIRNKIGFALLLAILLSVARCAYAAEIAATKVYCEFGKQSQTDVTEERDLSGNFNFYKAGASAKAEPLKDFSYKAGYGYYMKDFEAPNNNLDTFINIGEFSFSLPLYKSGITSLSFDTDYGLRVKRYMENPSSEYDENSLAAGLNAGFREDYSLRFLGGFEDYDYNKNHSSDYKKYFLKLSPSVKLFDKQLDLSGFYKRLRVDKMGKDTSYNEDTVSVRAYYKTGFPVLHKIGGYFEQGRNDTQDDEEDREDNLRFKYQVWDLSTYYKFHDRLDNKLTYGQKYRGYYTSINGYDNWFIKDKLGLELFKKDNLKIDSFIAGEHKETDFYQNSVLGYNKNSVSAGFSILKRSAWSVKPDFNFTKYKYPPQSTNELKSYRLGVELKKYIGSTDNTAEAGWSYKWKDYRYKPDIQQWIVNISYAIKF